VEIYRESDKEEVVVGEQLTIKQKHESRQVLDKFSDVLCGKLGRTKLADLYGGDYTIRVNPAEYLSSIGNR